jgi:hypothetical protein
MVGLKCVELHVQCPYPLISKQRVGKSNTWISKTRNSGLGCPKGSDIHICASAVKD